jgi:signal transduction histidine kinase
MISNAIDAVLRKDPPEEPTIVIRTGNTPRNGIQYAFIEISDNGPGIDPSHINNVFDPFFTTKDVGEGTGLGLSISIGIVTEHKGTIDVKSERNKGTVFTILLPLEQENA